ncbi:mgpp2cl-1, protein phosphatase 2C-like protein 1 [Taxawa tesnikishii (nom. ined.)]|nr:mgpp2cl-1, protein phosphatase 2C-like protein 1 [Dothideales sp. JES 119]
MFGSSGATTKENEIAIDTGADQPQQDSITDEMDKQGGRNQKNDDVSSPVTEKKRRSSGFSRARDMLSNAKQSLNSHSSPDSKADRMQTPMQRLGRTDPALSVPQGSLNNSAGESVPGPRSTFRVGVTEDKNKKCRRTMEDTHAYLYNFLSTPAPALSSDASNKTRGSLTESGATLSDVASQDVVETDNGYFAVFDGHAGTFAADWFDQQLEKLPLKNSGCTAVIAVLRWEDRIPNSQSATGSTAIAPAAAAAAKAASDSSVSVAADGNAIPQEEAKLRSAASRQRVLYTANVGDARIVLCRNGKALRLSYDHKGSDENEGKRIAGAGGLILNNRVNGVLAVTRALGDAYMKDLVTGHPYTTETVIQPDIDEFLILACDGLWDVCSDQEAVDLIRRERDPQTASRMLVEHALARFSTDNLSCMVVRFDGQRVQQTVERKAEPIGVEGDPATQKGGLSEAEAIVLEQKKKLDESGQSLERMPSDITEEEEAEPGPELNPAALEAARKDKKPLVDPNAGKS